MRRVVAVLVVTVFVAGVLAAIRHDGGPSGDRARLDVDGRVRLVYPSGDTEVLTAGRDVEFGVRVLVEDGTASIEYADGARFSMIEGDPGTDVLVDSVLEVVRGQLLVVDGFPTVVRYEDVVVRAFAATTVDAEAGLVRVFRGRAQVDGLGDDVDVPGLRQRVLSRAATITPIEFRREDPWDREYLGEAVAFGERLEALARGYTTGLSSQGRRGVRFFEAVLPALERERGFTEDLIDDRDPGETLVGAAIAVQGSRGTFRDRWIDVFAFRDAGALWGIVALDQGVSEAPLLEAIEFAIGETPTAPPPTTTTTTTSTTTTTTTTVPDSPSTTSTTTTTTTTTTPQGPLDEILDPLLDPVSELLAEVLDLLGSED